MIKIIKKTLMNLYLIRNDQSCKSLLQPVINRCDHTNCARNECMSALQHFYKTASHKYSIEIAVCFCRLVLYNAL